MAKTKKGFTVIEILIIIIIISILATFIFVSISSSRNKSRNLSVFYSMRGTADNAFSCLETNISNSRISAMGDATYSSICLYDSGGSFVDDPSYASWPDISKNGWDNTLQTNLTQDGFFWCALDSFGSTHPVNVGNYDGVSYGGASGGRFCYMLKNGDKYIWCAPEGCKKEGF